MKKFTLIIFLLSICFSFKTFAQEGIMGDVDYNLLQKYIQLAKQNYTLKKLADKRVEGAKTEVPIAALAYLDMANVSYIFRPNDQTALTTPGSANANPYAVNGLQFGLGVSLGQFFSRPLQIKKAKIDYEMAKLDAEQLDKTVELEVKTRYYNYVQQVALLKLNKQNLLDMNLVAEETKSKFEKTLVTLEVYDQSRLALTNAKVTAIATEVEYLKAKDMLEQIIGVKLADVK
ncbi:MAG TPA: TolC family protein [Mucilaginibacter sp.]|nr:TolC family protein [Mucilaginibacter sp.]